MLPKSVLVVSALLVGTLAQTTVTDLVFVTPSAPATTTSGDTETGTTTSTGITTHTINVGASGHKFTPDEVEADVGDIIEYRFYPTNHWVIRGDFDNPCIPYEYVGVNRKGFSSGDQSVQAITDDGPRFRVRVNNTDPIFFYCGAPGSCTRYHMMGVINPSKNETLDAWLAKASDVDYQLTPGEPWPTEADYTKPSNAVEETGASSNTDSDDDEHNHSTLSGGAIAGIAIGGAAVLLLAGGMIYLCGRRGGFDKAYRKSFRSSTTPMYETAPPAMGGDSRFDSPNTAVGSVWTGQKQPSPMSAYGQSPPLSPQNTQGYGFHPNYNPMMVQDGTIGSYYSDHAPPQPQHLAVPRQAETPKPQDQVAPAELPTSPDPGNSPLPAYDTGRNEQPRTFSWAGEETAYRPTKPTDGTPRQYE